MKPLKKIAFAATFGALCVASIWTSEAVHAENSKNWTPPSDKIYAQTLSDQIMAQHPELLSVTFHGVPPGATDQYTMFAGSYPERIGNVDDPDDVDIQKLGITILDPRWHRTKDTVKKVVVMAPLRDKAGENIGELVLAYKAEDAKSETDYFLAGTQLRDQLKPEIASLAALFAPAR